VPLLIDGHNLIGRLPDIDLDDPDDEARLVARLRTYCSRRHKRPQKAGRARATVVFDGGLPGGRSHPLSGSGVEVIFASPGRTADGILLERIRRARDPRGLTVVTSDDQIISVARARGARVVRSEEFVPELGASPEPQPEKDVHLSANEVEEWMHVFERKSE
jgi:predicted RNA-binding protein with PIN domain